MTDRNELLRLAERAQDWALQMVNQTFRQKTGTDHDAAQLAASYFTIAAALRAIAQEDGR